MDVLSHIPRAAAKTARQGVGGQTPTQTAMDSGTASAVAGTAIGAAAGALIGAAAGEPAGGTAIGAGSGLLLGGAGGTGTYESSAYALQNRYDITYVQCMYAKGNQVPVPAAYRDAFSRYQPPPPLPNSGAPAAACSTRRKATASPTRHTAAAQQSVKRSH